MGYTLDEPTYLVGSFPTAKSDTTVQIEVVDLEQDTLVGLTTAVCEKSSVMPDLYKWSTGNISTSFANRTGPINLFYKMTSSEGKVFIGKFVLRGYVEMVAKIDKTTTLTKVLVASS